MERFGFRISSETTGIRVAVSGEVDQAAASRLEAAIMQAGQTGRADVVVDLTGVSSMDASALEALSLGHRLLACKHRRLRVLNPPQTVTRLLDLTGMADWLEVEQSPGR